MAQGLRDRRVPMADMSREKIYTAYKEKVFRYIRGKVQNLHDAEDLTSSVFLKILSNLDTFDERKASLSTWIYRVTQNTVTDWFRTNRIQPEVPEDLPSGENLEEDYLREETLGELAAALGKMETREKDLLILHYYNGYTLKEIAGMMSLSYAMIKIIHKSALGNLRRSLGR